MKGRTCVTQSLPLYGTRGGAVIYAHWLTEEAAVQGLIALRMYLRRYGWKPSTVVLLLERDSSSQLQVMAEPLASPCTKVMLDPDRMLHLLKSLEKCLQQFEIAAGDDLMDCSTKIALILPE